mgnify:CR=1 FL=1
MSPTPLPPVKEAPIPPAITPVLDTTQRLTITSDLDSYLLERQKEQPKSLEEVIARAELVDSRPRHRMEMPPSIQQYFRSDKHPEGKYIPRWVLKDKRASDQAFMKGWVIFNRGYFPNAPRYLFSASGGIELGDTILMFMPVKQALAIREAPGKLSRERLKGQMTQTGPDTVLMSGNKQAEHIYQPELGPESAETSEEKVPGVLTADRDF